MAKAALLFVGTVDGLLTFSDPGASGRWLRVGHELRGEPIDAVWPLYDEPQIILAGGSNGVWRSDNGGVEWQKVSAVAALGFAGDRATPQVVSLTTTQATYKHSNDGGMTWRLDAGATPVFALPTRQRTELGGQQPVVLAVRNQQIERSTDGGQTWQPTTIDQPWQGEITIVNAARHHIDMAFAGSSSGQLASSSDRGRTWQIIKRDLPALRAIQATRLA